jgi:hypothetical protein
MKPKPSWIAYAALGPISGPLAAGAVRNWRKGERVLAGFYVAAMVEAFVLAPIVLAHLTHLVGAHSG